MARRSLALIASLTFGSLSIGCGEKGSGTGDETGGAGGSGGSAVAGSGGGGGSTAGGGGSGGTPAEEIVIHSFDANEEGFAYEPYTPDDPYTNLWETSTLVWDDGEGADGNPGRLRLDIPFDGYNQLADIQLNFSREDWTGKMLRARVMIESGFSPDPTAPGGAYIFLKTGGDYVWGRGFYTNLPPTGFGAWTTLEFIVSLPDNSNSGFDQSAVVSIGIQLATGSGMNATEMPGATVAYVDHFTLQ